MSLSALTAGEVAESLSIKQSARVLWDFEIGNQGWSSKNQISPYAASAGCLRGTATGADPYIYDPNVNQTSVKGSAGVAVRIWMSATSPLELFWENENGGFASNRRVVQTIPGQQWTTVHFDLSTHTEWLDKTISRLRLDPGTTGVSFIIDYVAVVDDFTTPSASFVTETFAFQPDMQGWTLANQITTYRLEDNKLKGKTNGIDPSITSPTLSLANQAGVVIQFKTDKAVTFKIYWSTTEGGLAESRSVSSALNSSTEWQTLKFDLRNHPQWAGKTITGLRIDPSIASGQTFEIDSVTFLGLEGVEDADGDLLDGLDELIYGTDPLQRSSIPGRLTQEKWTNLTNYSTTELYMSQAFYGKANQVQLGTLESPNLFFINHYATRHRGYLTAPTTGTYRFWITGCSGVELYLSTSDSKYHKKRIAQINPDASTGYGVPITSSNLWDMYVPQMSEDIYLQAGQKYYLEVVQTTGHTGNTHMNIAWAKPGQAREVLTTSYLESYHPTAEDSQDDDYLPDAWEIEYCLDPTDNGQVDITRQGERGDFDMDGLSNREEYVYGTDPSNPDTDGDGLVDSSEVRSYGTNPNVSDAPSGSVTSTLNLTSYTTTGSPWTLTSQGLVASSFRGSINWDFSIPSDGIWLLDVATSLLGDLYLNESVEVEVLIDGVSMGEKELVYGLDRDALLRVFTPYLTAGNHNIGLKINNMVTRRSVSIRNIDVVQPQGADLNQDDIPDWVAAQIYGENGLSAYAPISRTSPANLEGSARMRSLTKLNNIPVLAGVDQHHWFTNLSLNQTASTSFNVSLETGIEKAGAITWQSTNVFSAETLTIRKGDSLKLIAQPLTGATGQAVTLTFGPASWNGTIGASGTSTVSLTSDLNHHIYTLTEAGTYKVRATRPNGNTALMTIIVKKADFSLTPKDLFASNVGNLTFSTTAVTSSLYFEGGDTLYIKNPSTVSGSTITLQASPKKSGNFNMIARLQAGGPILGAQALNAVGLSDVIQNNSSFTYNSGDYPGFNIIRSPIVVTGLPEGATVVVTIFRAGVTFLNGTTTLTLRASDFVNDFYNLEFLFPETLSGGYCHYIDIYDRNGNFLGRR